MNKIFVSASLQGKTLGDWPTCLSHK